MVKPEANVDRVYPERKGVYFDRLKKLFATYRTILLVEADFVGSHQMQQVRMSLREKPKAEILMGKNTMVRQVIRQLKDEKPQLSKLLARKQVGTGYRYLTGNVGLVFTNDDPKVVRSKILENQVPAAAKVGNISPIDVFIPAGVTTLDPGQTGFFQALNIPTKITRAAIEIVADVHLIHKDQKVGNSEVALLQKLGIKPFSYGLVVRTIYEEDKDGVVYDAKVLDMSDEDIIGKFLGGVQRLACLSLRIGYPTLASLPHILANAMKKLIAISLATDYTFEQSKKYKDYLANPEAFAAAAPAAAAGNAAPAAGGKSAAAAAPEPEEEEEDFGGMGGMFD
jgi:large subunit ribosomal protein LP0